MLGDRRLGHFEDLDQRMHVQLTTLAVGKLLNNANPYLMTYCAKGLRKLFSDNDSYVTGKSIEPGYGLPESEFVTLL